MTPGPKKREWCGGGLQTIPWPPPARQWKRYLRREERGAHLSAGAQRGRGRKGTRSSLQMCVIGAVVFVTRDALFQDGGFLLGKQTCGRERAGRQRVRQGTLLAPRPRVRESACPDTDWALVPSTNRRQRVLQGSLT